jgi:nucleotide-binding universal stress UspA family protein
VLVPYLGSKHDRLALELSGRMARNIHAAVTVLHVTEPGRNSASGNEVSATNADGGSSAPTHAKTETERVFNDPTQPLPVTLKTVENRSPVAVVLEQSRAFDLVIVGVAEEWGLESHLLGFRAERIAREVGCSLLIVRKAGQFSAASGHVPVAPAHGAAVPA